MRMILGCGLNTIIMENVPLVPVSLIVWWTIVRRLWRTLLNMLIAIMDPSPVSSAGYLISLEVLGVRAATPTGDGAFHTPCCTRGPRVRPWFLTTFVISVVVLLNDESTRTTLL